MSSIKSSVVSMHMAVPVPLYLAVRRRADNQSLNSYIISLICQDCGISLDSLDYQSRARRTNLDDPPEGKESRQIQLVIPRRLYDAVKKKLAEQPYPVPVRGYLRTLIERDVVAQEDSSSVDDQDRVVDVQHSPRDEPPPLAIEEEELFCERNQEHFPILAKSRIHAWRIEAEQGSPCAQRLYGRCLMQGIGVLQDTVQALHWLLKSAEQGHGLAQLDLGRLYEGSKVVEQNEATALRWFNMAAEQGLAEAQYKLGCSYENGCGVEEDTTEAIRWYVAAAKQGHAAGKEALYNLFMFLLERGNVGDDLEAFQCLRKAADLGFVEAQVALGYRYAHGHGLPQDDDEALHWNRMAAEQGSAEAQYELGCAYENGWGVEPDTTEAIRWYAMAANQGHDTSKKELKRLEEELSKWVCIWKPS